MTHRFLIFLFLFLFIVPVSVYAKSPVQTMAKQAILIDFETGMTLFAKNADQKMPTSSMSKVMTAYMVFDAVQNGSIALDDTLLVSKKAWKKQGSKMFVEAGKRVKVEDLIRGVIIQSGNDATIVLAEGLAGTEEEFAKAMTMKAKEIGMMNSNFMNASGWPDKNHYSTARDLSTLAVKLIEKFPEYYHYYSETEFTHNKITQKNRNPLLYRNMGADGIKTGHTNIGGYGVIGSGEHNGRRAILVINGLDSSRERAQEGAKLLEWGLRGFVNKVIRKDHEEIARFDVAYGKEASVPVGLAGDLKVTMPSVTSERVTAETTYEGPLVAPIQKGDVVGEVRIMVPGQKEPITRDLVALETIEDMGIFSKTIAKAKHFFAAQL